MKHIVYIHPFVADEIFGIEEFQHDASADPKKFLESCRRNDEMTVYDTPEAFAEAFNGGEVSDEGYVLVVEDNVTRKDIDLDVIRLFVRSHGYEEPLAKGVKVFDVAPRDFYSMENDPFGVIEDKLHYDGIDVPVLDDDGYMQGSYLMTISLIEQEPGQSILEFSCANDTREYSLRSDELYSETIARIRELLTGTFGPKEYAWLTFYRNVYLFGASEGIRRSAAELGRELVTDTLFEGKADEKAVKHILEAMRDPDKDSERLIGMYLK